MGRLTERSANSNMVWFKDCENNNARLEPCEMTAHHNRMVLEKLSTYEDLEEQGLLLRLPYPLGTEYIYFVDIKDREVYKLDAEKIEISMKPISKKILYTIDSYEFLFEDFKKAIFFTKSEAEAKLKELMCTNDSIRRTYNEN